MALHAPHHVIEEAQGFDHVRPLVEHHAFGAFAHRRIGDFGGQHFSVHGEKMEEAAFRQHLEDTLPREEDKVYMRDLMKTKDWIAPATQSVK